MFRRRVATGFSFSRKGEAKPGVGCRGPSFSPWYIGMSSTSFYNSTMAQTGNIQSCGLSDIRRGFQISGQRGFPCGGRTLTPSPTSRRKGFWPHWTPVQNTIGLLLQNRPPHVSCTLLKVHTGIPGLRKFLLSDAAFRLFVRARIVGAFSNNILLFTDAPFTPSTIRQPRLPWSLL